MPGSEPGTQEADLHLVLPGGLAGTEAARALTASVTWRLYLLGHGRVAVDDGRQVVQVDGVEQLCRGSLLMEGSRLVRAELWLSDRVNLGATLLDALS